MTSVYRLMANDLSNPTTFNRGLYGNENNIHPPFRALELASVLQTTLDIGELLGLFMQEIQSYVEFDGLRYHDQAKSFEIIKGKMGRHSLSYIADLKGQNLGEITFSRSRTFSEEEIRNVEDLLVALLYPLRNTLAYRRALLSALIDPLTGVNNRAAMNVVMKREVELAKRRELPLSVILIDIDFFKKINDTFGHSAGDLCLQAVANCINDSIRVSDLLFRCGGEEFLVLLSQTEHEGAFQLAERIREHVRDLTLPIVGDTPLTVSLGVTQLRLQDDMRSLYDRADNALYQAKRSGRNRVKAL